MKLYATTTTERATKGQGGNKRLDIQLQVSADNKTIIDAGVVAVREVPLDSGTFIITYLGNGGHHHIATIKGKKLQTGI